MRKRDERGIRNSGFRDKNYELLEVAQFPLKTAEIRLFTKLFLSPIA